MFHSPIFDIILKYERFINDTIVLWIIMFVVLLLDNYISNYLNLNLPTLSLLIYILGYSIAYAVIRKKGAKEHFGGFANNSWHYCVFLATFAWLVYLLFVRSKWIG